MSAASKIRRRAALLATWGVLAGCASAGGGFEQLPAEEQAMFRRCRQPLGAHLCRNGSAQCLEAQAETFAARRSTRMRRNWLVLNECPASVIDGAEPPAEVTAKPAPAEVTATPAVAEVTATPAAPEVTATPETPEVTATPATAIPLLAAGAACRKSAECESDLCVRGACRSLASLELDRTCAAPAPAPVVAVEASPRPPEEPVKPALPLAKENPALNRPPPEHLREAIVVHEAEMKKCVERQLKLVPDLRAEGTLVLEVDAAGKVTQAALRGERLQGTALEGCVRAIAARWVFPRKARAYAVEAPLHVSGAR